MIDVFNPKKIKHVKVRMIYGPESIGKTPKAVGISKYQINKMECNFDSDIKIENWNEFKELLNNIKRECDFDPDKKIESWDEFKELLNNIRRDRNETTEACDI